MKKCELHAYNVIWDKVFKNGPIKICGRQISSCLIISI